MSNPSRPNILYKITVKGRRVSIEAISDKDPEFVESGAEPYHRLRDAITLDRDLKNHSSFENETFYFAVLSTAKDFAEMVIMNIEERLLDEFDAIESFGK